MIPRISKFIRLQSLKILVALGAITMGLGAGIFQVEISRTIDDSTLPETNQLMRSLRSVRSTFGDNSKQVIVSVFSDQTMLSKTHLSVIDQITKAMETVPSIKPKSLVSLANTKMFESKDGELFLSPVVDWNNLDSKADQHDLEKRIKKNKFIYGKIISKNFKMALIVGSVDPNIESTIVHQDISAILKPVQDQNPNLTIDLLGDPEVNYQLYSNIQRELFLFLGIAFTLMGLSLYFIFKTWQGVLYPLLTTVLSCIWTMGAIGYYGEPINILSVALPVVLAVIASSFGIHVYFGLLTEKSIQKAFEKFLSPILVASATTFIGGISLLAFKIRPLQHFGLFTAIGTFFALVLSLLLIPALFHHFQSSDHFTQSVQNNRVRESSNLFSNLFRILTLTRFSIRHAYGVIFFSLLVSGVATYFSTFVQVGFDRLSLFPPGSPLKKAIVQLDSNFKGMHSLEAMITFKKSLTVLDPHQLKKIDRFEKEVLKLEQVKRSFSIVPVIKKVHEVISSQNSVPKNQQEISEYLLLLEMSGASQTIQDLVNTDYTRSKTTFSIATDDTKQLEVIVTSMQRSFREIFGSDAELAVGGQLVFLVAMMQSILWGKIQNVLLAMLLIFSFVMIRYRSSVRSLVTFIPIPFSALASFGLMGAMQIRLDFITAMITSFAMGIGVEFSVYMVAAIRKAYKKTRNLEKSILLAASGPGKAIQYSAICCIIGFSALSFSTFNSIVTFSILMCFNMAVILLATFVILPAIIKIAAPEFIVGSDHFFSPLKRRLLFVSKVVLCALFMGTLAFGVYLAEAQAEVSVQDIIDRSVRAGYSEHEESIYVMRIKGADGSESMRKMKVWFNSKGDQEFKLLIKFTDPAPLRGTGFLSVYRKGEETSQWLYLPSLKKSRRITGGNSNESFLGSDFTLGDVSVDPKNRFNFKITGQKPCGSETCYILEGVPMAEGPYSKKVLWIGKESYLNVSSEFYNSSGKLEKKMTLGQIHKNEQGKIIADRVEMQNLETKRTTVLEFEKRDATKVPADSLFTPQNLEK